MILEGQGAQEAQEAHLSQAALCGVQVVHLFRDLLFPLAFLGFLYHLFLLRIHHLLEVQHPRVLPFWKWLLLLHHQEVLCLLWRLALPGLPASQASLSLQPLPFFQVLHLGPTFLSLLENQGSQAALRVPLGLENQVDHLPLWGLEPQEALGDHQLLVGLGDQGGPSSQPVQRAPCLLAGLSNLGPLGHPEFQEVLVVLGSLEHLFHRNGQGNLGSLESQDFPLCLWDL